MAHWSRALVLLASGVAVWAQGAAKAPAVSAFSKPALEAYVRHLNMWPAQVTVTISDPVPSASLPGFSEVKVKASLGGRSAEIPYLISKDGRKVLQANVYDITQNPFAEDLAKLKDMTGAASMGTPGATAVIVAFSDFQCSFCREEAKILRENLLRSYPTQVRLYFRDFPLDALHPWARTAAIGGRCVFRQNAGAFWKFHDWIFDKQAEVTVDNVKAKMVEWAGANQLDGIALSACIDTKATEAEVEASLKLGRELNVNSTPTMFLNGRRLAGSLPWEQWKALIDAELSYQKTAKNAGEDCGCDVSLPAAPGTAKPKATLQ